MKSRSAWFENGTEKARKLKKENSKRLIKSAILGNADMIADEKAARQKNHEKRTVFHGFLLFMRQKRVFMKSEVKIIF